VNVVLLALVMAGTCETVAVLVPGAGVPNAGVTVTVNV
jgi:hypothetical protein